MNVIRHRRFLNAASAILLRADRMIK